MTRPEKVLCHQATFPWIIDAAAPRRGCCWSGTRHAATSASIESFCVSLFTETWVQWRARWPYLA